MLIIWCTGCRKAVGFSDVAVGEPTSEFMEKTVYCENVIPIGTEPVQVDGKQHFVCPNCHEGRLLFYDHQLTKKYTYDPWDPWLTDPNADGNAVEKHDMVEFDLWLSMHMQLLISGSDYEIDY